MSEYRLSLHMFFRSLLPSAVLLALATGVPAGENSPFMTRDLKDLSIEELMNIEVDVVYSASKFRQKVNEAPSSVTIITAEEIRRYGYRTLADILRSVRGFFTTYDRSYTYVGVRGFARPGDFNTRILLIVDGHRLNDNIYDSATFGAEFIMDVDLIDRVEISRGPGSSLWGSNAFFAVVNIVSRTGADLAGAELSGEAGSFDTYKGRVSLGARDPRGIDAVLSESILSSHGDRLYFPVFDERNSLADPRANNGGYANNADFERSRSFLSKIASGNLTVAAAYGDRTKGIPTSASGIDFNDPDNRTMDGRGYIDAQYARSLGSERDVTLHFYYDYYRHDASYLYSGVVNKDWSYGSWWGGEGRFSIWTRGSHHLVMGAERQDNRRQDQGNADQEPYVLYLDDSRRSRTWAAYIQDELTVLPSLILNAGVRYDHTSTFGGTYNPRLAAIVRMDEQDTFKLLYGSAFRAPNVYELYYASSAVSPPMASNPDLHPEEIDTYEAVYEHFYDPQFRLTLSGYYYRIRDLIVQRSDLFALTFENLDVAEGRGVEAELERRWTSGLQGRASYAFQRAIDGRTGTTLPNSPRHLAKLALSIPLFADRWLIGMEQQYTSKRKALDDGYLDAYFLTNISVLFRNASRSLELSATVYNLFDEGYSDPVAIEFVPVYAVRQNGRTARVKMTYAF